MDVIRKAASRAIIDKGFDTLSVSDIAEAAGLSVGGIYRYITTKTDLLVMVCKGIYDGVREELGEVVAGDLPIAEKLERAIGLYLLACEDRRAEITMVYREYRRLPVDAQQYFMLREQAIADVFVDLIRAGCSSGVFAPVNARLLALDIVFLGHMPSLKGWALRGVAEPPEVRDEQIKLILARVSGQTNPTP